MSRAFDEAQLRALETGASDEVARLCAEVRRLYAAEDAAQNSIPAVVALLSATHQQLHAAARTLESAARMISPQQEKPRTSSEPQRKRPQMMMDDQPD
jgi:hypothetical protein